jgi:hypothetical protein
VGSPLLKMYLDGMRSRLANTKNLGNLDYSAFVACLRNGVRELGLQLDILPPPLSSTPTPTLLPRSTSSSPSSPT